MRPFFASVVDQLRASALERGANVRQVRWETRAALAHHRSMRRAIGRTIRVALVKQRASVIRGLKTALAPVMAGKAPEAHVAAATRPAPSLTHSGVWDLWPDNAEDRNEDAWRQVSQAHVLTVIQRHPEGIRARDVGNELGVDWRHILSITNRLLDAGLVEQVGQEFYPSREASRQC